MRIGLGVSLATAIAISVATLVVTGGGGGGAAADYFVASNGSDSNPGTLASPFLTFDKCYQTAGGSTAKTCEVAAGEYLPQSVQTKGGVTQLVTFQPASGATVKVADWVHLGTSATYTVGNTYTLDLSGGEDTAMAPLSSAVNCPTVGVSCYQIRIGAGSGGYFECTGKTSTTFTGCKDITGNDGLSPWTQYAGSDIHYGANSLILVGNNIKVTGMRIGDAYLSGANDWLDANPSIHQGDTEGIDQSVTNNTIGNTTTGGASWQVGTSAPGPANLTVTDNLFTSVGVSDCGTVDSASCHAEAMHIQGNNGAFNFSRNRMYAIDVFNLSFQHGGSANWVGPFTIENNFFDCRWGKTVLGADAPDVRTCAGTSLSLDSFSSATWTFRNNSCYSGGTAVDVSGTFASSTIRGNIGCQIASASTNGCSHTGITCSYNLNSNATNCPGTNETNSVCGWVGTSWYVDETLMDLHLNASGATTSPLTRGDPSFCPSVDVDNIARPIPGATTCDAGADERN